MEAGGCVVVCVVVGDGGVWGVKMRRSRSRRGNEEEEEGGGCIRKQSVFVLIKSGYSGVRNKPRLKKEAKK